LLDNYRNRLTGLSEDEARAIFLHNIPSPLAQLGIASDIKSALRKLMASLPAKDRFQEQSVRQRIHLDSVAWDQTLPPTPYLPLIHRAIWEDHQLLVTFRSFFDTVIKRTLSPYGLVAKASIWYLVYAWKDTLRVMQVSELVDVQRAETRFARPMEFNLAAFWDQWCKEFEAYREIYRVETRVSPILLPILKVHFGDQVGNIPTHRQPEEHGKWLEIVLPFKNLEEARARILGYGGAIEVVKPKALRLSILDYARQTVRRYE
jgi:predicted DNA-binding transcriptional regulator YafY